MSFRFYRVFCSDPGLVDNECQTFLDAIAEVNEGIIGSGNLFVPAFLPVNLTNKPTLQKMVDQNVEDSTFFVQILRDTWGPPEHHMEHEFQLARRCRDDASRPMQSIAVFLQQPAAPELAAIAAPDASHNFATLDELRAALVEQLREWSQSMALTTGADARPLSAT
ncbi:MAG TPA: hypothetical protein VML19_08840 [Verrucomicrobiae bacterium]|nr:hypothetical protein [Verrucomicrobiae bacterium]